MTKNELDAVIRVLEQATRTAYDRGYFDATDGDSPRPAEYFKLGPGAILLLQRELKKR